MTKGKTTRKTNKRAKTTSKPKVTKSVQEAREQFQKLVSSSSGKIISAVIAEAKKGKYLPAKFLFEAIGMCEARPESAEPAEKHDDSLAQILLEQWHLKPAPQDSDDEGTQGSGEAEEDAVTVG